MKVISYVFSFMLLVMASQSYAQDEILPSGDASDFRESEAPPSYEIPPSEPTPFERQEEALSEESANWNMETEDLPVEDYELNEEF